MPDLFGQPPTAPPDWPDVVSAVSDGLTAPAAIAALVIAIVGARGWLRQLRGQSEFDVARRVLRTVYHIRDGLELVRNPLMTPSEVQGNPRADSGSQNLGSS